MSRFNSRTAPAPMGVSEKWLDQRDDELREQHEEETAPTSLVRNSPLYQAQVRLCAELRRQLAELRAENEALKAGPAPKKTRVKKSDGDGTRGRLEATPIIVRDGVEWATYKHVAKLKGLNQSNVWRQIEKRGITHQRFDDAVWRIPASQIENINKREKKRKQ